MSRIAIIDTAIDPGYIGDRAARHINLCGGNNNTVTQEIGHGTLCAMVLDHCTSDYELVNIQIFRDNKAKVFGEVEILAKALKLCRELKVDIVSLSAVSSILSDSKYLYDITRELSGGALVVSALDNKRYVTVPTSYPHVLGVRSDNAGRLSPGELAYRTDDPFGANIYANCDFAFLREKHYGPSNSLAVPVAAAYVNDLLNQRFSICEIESHLKNLRPYPISACEEPFSQRRQPDKEIPVVFLADDTTENCVIFMDSLHEKYEIQATALSFAEGAYDVRIKPVKDIGDIEKDLHFMENSYKTDIVFIVGGEDQLEEVLRTVDIDIKLICRGSRTLIIYENGQESEPSSCVSDRLYEILTT